jgi:MoxR-like ATPase
LAVAFSRALSLDYRRVQFTPDVLPSDVVGFSMFNKKLNDFEFKEGAAMCNLLLADEINRTSPKTQAALLEVMEERKVTVDGVAHVLPNPFIVIATQNPVGYVGTQKLPESQLDRFMIKLSMGYPDAQSEINVYKGQSYAALGQVNRILEKDSILKMREQVKMIHVEDSIFEYVSNLVRDTRENPYISLGISPRGGLALIHMAKGLAFLYGRDYVVPEDVLEALPDVALHRIVLSSKAKANGLDEQDILKELKEKIVIP